MYGRGGIQTHTHYLATGLVARGHSVTVVTPAPINAHAGLLRKNTDYRLITYRGFGDTIDGLGTGRSDHYDVAVVCGTGWKAMAGVLARPRIGKRVFFEVMSGQRTGFFDPRALVHAGFDAIVGQGRPVEARFRNEFGWGGQSTTIPALPEPLELQYDIPKRAPLPIEPGNGLRLAYFGRLVPHKGVALLIENWPMISQFARSLDVHGGGAQRDELQALIATRGLESVIQLCGPYPEGQDYIDLLQQYDLKVLPTVGDEGAPLVLLEAMACGLPFVANAVGGISDYANLDCAVTDGDIEALWPLLERFAARLCAGSVDVARLQSLYHDQFSYDALTGRWENFLCNLACADTASAA